jgi:hypothetical protein
MDKPKDFWDKLSAIGTVTGSILIPIALLIIGNQFSFALKERELQAEYVKQSIEILSRNDSKDMPRSVRLYALNVLKESSPVPIPPELEGHLLDSKPERDKYWTSDSFGSGSILRLTSAVEQDLYVYIDDKIKAMTPATVELKAGKHKVEFRDKLGKTLSSAVFDIDSSSITNLRYDPTSSPSIIEEHKNISE